MKRLTTAVVFAALIALAGCYGAQAASSCPNNAANLDEAYATIEGFVMERGLRYVAEEKPWPGHENGIILYVITENGGTFVGYFDNEGCLEQYTNQYPAGFVAALAFDNQTRDELFPPAQ